MDKSSLENIVEDINTKEMIKEKLEAKISDEIDSRIANGLYDDYINSEVQKRIQTQAK